MDWSSKLDDFASNELSAAVVSILAESGILVSKWNLVLIPDSLTDVRLLLK